MIQLMQFGQWLMQCATAAEYLSPNVVKQCSALLGRWKAVFDGGSTWVEKTYGVPSLIVRLDFIVDNDGVIQVYEIEDRPCGIGVSSATNIQFSHALQEIKKTWPKIAWIAADNRPSDDEIWLGPRMSFAEAEDSGLPLLIRARPTFANAIALEHRAICPVSQEGDKSYGVDLGLWTECRYVPDRSGANVRGQFENFPQFSSCIKPVQGTRSLGISFYLDAQDAQTYQGLNKVLSKAELEKRVHKERRVFCQRFIPPMKCPHVPHHGMIYRFFFGFHCLKQEYEPIGGVWMADKSLLIHGTPTTITGPLVM